MKGFISIIASLLILFVGSVALYEYGQSISRELNSNLNDVREDMTKLGGSLVATKYGGTGTSTATWSGLLRLATGTWATTTLTDDDVPDALTITSISGSISLDSVDVSGTSSFTGVSTFGANPIVTLATPTSDYELATKYYVDQENEYKIGNVVLASSTQIASTTATTSYVLMKQIGVYKGGSFRVTFDLAREGGSVGLAYGQIFLNGVATGTEYSTNTESYMSVSKDLYGLTPSTSISIYGKKATQPTNCYIKNFYV
jgi:hypothetical protein